MKNKLKIGIDINEVLRATWISFDRYFYEQFGDEGIPDKPYVYITDFFKHYKWEDTTETTRYLKEPEEFAQEKFDDINPQFYQVDENGNTLADSFLFQPNEELKLSAKEVYNRFLYQDFCFEIYGFAMKMYKQLDLHFKNFCIDYGDDIEIIVVSKENFFSIVPTLHFLSLIGSRATKYVFDESSEEIWDNVDILVTADPEMLSNIPLNKKAIKVMRPFNVDIKSDFEIMEINDLNKLEEPFNAVVGSNEYLAFKEYEKYNKHKKFLKLIK